MARKAFLVSFVLVAVLSIGIAGYALKNEKWDTVTASLSLLIAIVSAWVAYEAFHRQDEAKRPQLVLSVDADSRYGMIQLVCTNAGELPAYNIIIRWDKPFINNENKPATFNYSGLGPDIVILNPKQAEHTWVTTDIEFYDKKNSYDMSYSGSISFQESLNSKKRTVQPFMFAILRHGRTLAAKTEDVLTMTALQKLPSALEGVTAELRQWRQATGAKSKNS